MRDRHICPKCDHNEILRIAEVADEIGEWRNREKLGHATPAVRDSFSTVALRLARFPETKKSPGTNRHQSAGVVRAYACRRCGYTELYTEGVADIPVDGVLVTILTGKAKEGPFR